MKCMEADAKCFECETSTCSPAAVNPAGLHHSLQEAAWWVPVQFWKPLASSTPLECVLFNTQPPLKLPKYVLSSIFLTTLTKSNTFLLSFWGLIMSVALICLWHISLRVPAWDCHQPKPSFNTIYKPLWSPPGGTYQDLLWKSPWAATPPHLTLCPASPLVLTDVSEGGTQPASIRVCGNGLLTGTSIQDLAIDNTPGKDNFMGFQEQGVHPLIGKLIMLKDKW